MALPEYRAAIAEPKLPKELTEPRKGQPDPKGYRAVRVKYIKIEKFSIHNVIDSETVRAPHLLLLFAPTHANTSSCLKTKNN